MQHVINNVVKGLLPSGINNRSDPLKAADLHLLLYGFSHTKNLLANLPDAISAMVLAFLSFEELRILFMSHGRDPKCIKRAFNSRTNCIPWVINVIVRNPIGKHKCKYIYTGDDIVASFMSIGNYKLHLDKRPILCKTVDEMSKQSKCEAKIDGETIWRSMDCVKVIMIKGVGGKISLLSYMPKKFNIPLLITRENDVYRCSIEGERFKINHISHYGTKMTDQIYFSDSKLKSEKPTMLETIVKGTDVSRLRSE